MNPLGFSRFRVNKSSPAGRMIHLYAFTTAAVLLYSSAQLLLNKNKSKSYLSPSCLNQENNNEMTKRYYDNGCHIADIVVLTIM